MALQDLTPQLRTRLNRTEKAAGWFVLIAIILLVFGFSYYLYSTAERKGWFIEKVSYHTGVNDTTGLKVGDPVRLMGYSAGEITEIKPNDPGAYYGVTIYFSVKNPHYGYIWSDSEVKVSADLFNNRYLEITKGKRGLPTIDQTTNGIAVGMLKRKFVKQQLTELLAQSSNNLDVAYTELNAAARAKKEEFYDPLTNKSAFWLNPAEAPSLSDRAERMVSMVESALPNVLALTNTIGHVLVNTSDLTSNLNAIAVDMRPAASNLAYLSAELRGPGALGTWALGDTNMVKVGAALDGANSMISHTDTNLTALLESMDAAIDNLAGITSNLNVQVQNNTNILSNISKSIVDTDDLVQGLKRHWLLRSAFKTKATNAPAKK